MVFSWNILWMLDVTGAHGEGQGKGRIKQNASSPRPSSLLRREERESFGCGRAAPSQKGRCLVVGGLHSTVELLKKLPLATQGGNTLFQNRLEEIAASRGWQLNIQLRCESFPQAAQVLASDQMAAVLPDLARLALSCDKMWVYPLRSLNELQREVHLAWHPHRLETRPHLAGVRNRLAEVLKFVF